MPPQYRPPFCYGCDFTTNDVEWAAVTEHGERVYEGALCSHCTRVMLQGTIWQYMQMIRHFICYEDHVTFEEMEYGECECYG